MNLNWFRGIRNTSEFNHDLWNRTWRHLQNWWNDHDSGLVAFTNISFGLSITSKTANYAATTSDHLIFMDTTSAALTLTLPTSVGLKGKQYVVMNIGTKNLAIATTSSQTINGNTSTNVPNKYFHITLFSDGANWLAL